MNSGFFFVFFSMNEVDLVFLRKTKLKNSGPWGLSFVRIVVREFNKLPYYNPFLKRNKNTDIRQILFLFYKIKSIVVWVFVLLVFSFCFNRVLEKKTKFLTFYVFFSSNAEISKISDFTNINIFISIPVCHWV